MRLANPRNMLAACVFLSVIVYPAAGEIIYVNDDAGGANDGTSWTDAYTDLQSALLTSSSGDQIWVAAGTYKPGTSSEDFFSMKNGVGIYGGFPDSGDPNMADRDWHGNPTILSGDIGVDGYNLDNCRHVFYHSDMLLNLDSSAVLDGFTITDGYNSFDDGAGMYNEDCSPTISNCTFVGNIATNGGALYNISYSSPTLINCIFYDNSATAGGGGIFNTTNSSPILTNCTFYNNTATTYGGGIYNVIVSSSILTNCILWGDTAGTAGNEIYNGVFCNSVVTYSDVDGGWPGTGNIDTDPCFADAASGDFHLLSDSPCIDAGTNTAPSMPSTDFEGDARIINGRVDMGVDEVVEYELVCLAEPPAGGTFTLDPAGGYYFRGTMVTVTANGAGVYVFDHWSGDLTGSTNPETIIMDSAKTITAHFFRYHQLTVSVDPAASGNVILEPPGGLYAPGTEVTVTANPSVGYGFDHWSGALTGSANPETIVMDTDKAITAHFGYTLTVNTTPVTGGSVTLEPPGGIYQIETEVTLTAQPAPSFAFDRWSGDLTGSTNPTTIFIDSAKSVSAHFIFGADIIYVNDDANGANNGHSWTNAFTDLQDALACSTPGKQIWVAAGTYTPDPCGLAEPREASFQMKNGVGIYGGFAGDEDPNVFDLADRDFTTNETILSGDIGIPDVNTDNCYLVIYNRQGTTLDSNTVLDGFTITGSNADSGALVFGGGMLNEGASDYPCSPTVTNCTFRDNLSQYGGGMVNSNYSSPTVTNCTFSGNISTYSYNGGGMINADYSNPTVTNCTFHDNLSVFGGGMGNTKSSPTVTNCTFRENHAAAGGGMSNRYNSSPTVTDCTFSGNEASDKGGGMYNEDNSSPTVTDCTFSSNTASTSGGGMYNYGSSPTVSNCIFIGNSATSTYFDSGGGGMYNEGSSPTVSNCIFIGNSATGTNVYNGGGGMYNNSGSPTVTNCTFSGNEASVNGGGMFNRRSINTIINCTFIGNSAGNGGGMYNYNYTNPTVTNCILWGDEPDEIYNTSASPTVTYSDVQGGWPDANNTNIDADPRFVDPNNPDPNLCNLRLKLVSPCIDAGNSTPLVDVGISQDMDGLMRFVDIASVPDTGIGLFEFVDMGAYEFECNYTHGDVNCDGVVDFKDVAILCGNWLAGVE